MSLVDDARRLTFTPWEDSCHLTCESCDKDVKTTDVPNGWTGHAPDCPWLALPRIVAALEAAERVRELYAEERQWQGQRDQSDPMWAAFGVLETALRGEEVPA